MASQPHPRSLFTSPPGPEARLLLCCARTQPDPETIQEMALLTSLPLDWAFLLDSADKHRLTQVLYKNLTAHCADALPGDVRGRLRHCFYTNAADNLGLANELIRILKLLEDQGICAIPFKGSVMALCTYGKLAFRQSYDLDLLIRHRDFEKCDILLRSEGYDRELRFDRAHSYKHESHGLEIDIHWGFAPRYFHLNTDFDDLNVRAMPIVVLEHDTITFSPEDLLQILCLQVMKDAWERRQQLEHLSKICDIAEHLRVYPQLEWAQVFQQAREDGLQRVVNCALILAVDLLGAKLPPQVLQETAKDLGARKMARRMCRSLFTQTDQLSPLKNSYLSLGLRVRQLSFYLGMRERNRDRLRHIWEILKAAPFKPSPASDRP